MLSQLRLGHTNITHAYLMQMQSDPPECNGCRCLITVEHLLLDRRKYSAILSRYYNNPLLTKTLAEVDGFYQEKLVSYLKETRLYDKI